MAGIAGFTRFNADCTRARLVACCAALSYPGDRQERLFETDVLLAGQFHQDSTGRLDTPVSLGEVQLWLDGEAYDVEDKNAFAETLLQAYRKGDLNAQLAKVEGYFSAALYDAARQQVLFFGDRFGFKPLYIWVSGEKLAWASSLKAFLNVPDFELNWNKAAMQAFLDLGFVPADQTWFVQVQRLPAATILQYDLQTKTIKQETYWNWRSKPPFEGTFEEAVDELLRLLRRSVKKRLAPNTLIGLSGGLDSRALLALSLECQSVRTFSFGQPDCWDIRIAQQVTQQFGVDHLVLPLSPENWWQGRLESVWRADGFKNLFHLHLSPHQKSIRALEAVHLNGFLGGIALGGIYAQAKDWKSNRLEAAEQHLSNYTHFDPPDRPFYQEAPFEAYRINNRQRRFTMAGVEEWGHAAAQRMPFTDAELLEFLYTLPADWRAHSRLYNALLLRHFPAFFKTIPWQRTGVPIAQESLTRWILRSRWRSIQNRLGWIPDYSSTNYPQWAQLPERMQYFRNVLDPKKAVYPDLMDRNLSGLLKPPSGFFANRLQWIELLGRAVTLEYWLRRCYKQD
ncbi:MAG: hypothetical protein KDC44_04280 [Phaeodactylibacter sp.]|nr:hypothetical protein [Phaeodactylibacter sp.]